MSDEEEDTENENTERTENLSALAKDAAHPFDQTNGIVEGLDGDADDPEQVERRLNDGAGAIPLATPPGSGAGVPITVRPPNRDDVDSDDDEPA